MSTAPSLLDVARIDTYRGIAQILRGVSLSVREGEAVCLVGRNGAGKTTTIDTVIGLLTPRAGSIAFRGRDVTGLPPHERARLGIGYAPEDAGVFPDLTVDENFQVAEWITAGRGRAAAAGRTRIYEVFPEVRAFLTRRGLHLSGGQKKMVAITRAMTLNPSVLLLDEPFEGLAPVIVTRFIEAVRTIKTMGISVLIAESHVANAARVADRLYAIDRGEIIFEGHPRDVLADENVMRTIRG